ncbi:MAG TPA: hypothetical protein VK996_07120 [Ramlibacter sp.]|nr:hypothetical protein [Ramlibacter sp.]
MKKLLPAIALAAVLGACTTISKVEGDQVVNGRLAIKVTEAWNKVSVPGTRQPYDMWTQEGMTLDHLRIWAGIKAGEPLMLVPSAQIPAGQKAPRVPTFTGNMPPEQIVNLFEMMYAVDGSMVKVNRVEPTTFAGEKGVHFEFTIVRKRDDLHLLGTGWASVRNNELFAATFVAPKLTFYPRLAPRAAAIVKTAQIRG